MPPFARAIVIDAHPLIRLSLRQHFSETTAVRVVADFTHTAALLACPHTGPVDVAIIDDAAASAMDAITDRLGCKVVVFTDSPDAPIERHAALRGAAAVVHKTSPLFVLHAAVRTAI